ncbi:MAG: hypothetical protein H8E44_18790 [Planctomycetes bacterium]|nr:hypothetical protein [Planctomycetota bacterium]
MFTRFWKSSCLVVGLLTSFTQASFAELLVGTASTDITPSEPVAISGQFHLRLSGNAETPITANVLALESREGDKALDLAIMVSCDMISIPADLLELVRQEVTRRVPDLDTSKIFLSGTHTHTAPEPRLGKWVLPEEGVMQVEQYRAFFAERVADAIAKAWEDRAAGSVSWSLGHAVVAYNRRAVYANGTARMYGSTTVPEFRGLEGYEDHDVPVLFAWNAAGELIAMAVNVACPSQEVESRTAINADFWHPVREALHKKYGGQVCVLGWTGAAGDQSPHLMYRKAAEERMRQLRGLTRLEEIARRVVRAVDEAYEVVKDDRHTDIPLVHKVETVRLPMRLVTESEYAEAKGVFEQTAAQLEKDPKSANRVYRRMKWYEVTVNRFERQKTDPNPTLDMELHVVRIGDAVVCTNQFELFTDYGIRIKARSKAVQTFVIQLVGPGTYLPTEKAVRGGHYSAIVHSSLVGPKGGQVLVDRTVELIDSMWDVE